MIQIIQNLPQTKYLPFVKHYKNSKKAPVANSGILSILTQDYAPPQRSEEYISKRSKLTRKSQLNKIITNKDGSPDHLAINIYYDTLRSWYSPLKQYQADGNILHIKKLKTPAVYASAEQLANTHGVSKNTIRRKLVKLEQLGLIQRGYKHKSTATTKTYNQRCIYVLKDTPHFFNPYGVDLEEIKELKSQTNAKFIQEKYGTIFGMQSQLNKEFRVGGGIITRDDTKELIESFNKLKDRSMNIISRENKKESNLFNNSDLILTNTTTAPATINPVAIEQAAEAVLHNDIHVQAAPQPEASIHPLKPHKPRLSTKTANKRRKPTTAQRKAGKGKLLRFKQYAYAEPQDLSYHYPLTAEDASLLQSKSGREFTLNFQNELLLAMSRKPELQDRKFLSKARFMAYMAKALLHEMRDAEKTANTGFYIKANKAQAEIKQFATIAAEERFLNAVETESIMHVSPENQLKAKLASTLKPKKAYQLLSSYKSINTCSASFEMHLSAYIELTAIDKEIILNAAGATHARIEANTAYTSLDVRHTSPDTAYISPDGNYLPIEKIEFIMPAKPVSSVTEQVTTKTPRHTSVNTTNRMITGIYDQGAATNSTNATQSTSIPATPRIGIWGKIREEFANAQGIDGDAIDNHWLSKLDANINKEHNSITLKAPSQFIKSFIQERFLEQLKIIAKNNSDAEYSINI